MGLIRTSGILLSLSLLSLTACHRRGFPEHPPDYREFAYVTNGGSNTVTVLDLVNLRQERVLSVGANPTGIAASPTRNEVYAVNTGSNSVSVIDAETNRVAATIPVHRRPYLVDVDQQGARAYVANSGSNDVSVIDLARRRVVATAAAGEAPGEARISPDDRTLVVSNRASNSVSLIDAHTFKLRAAFNGCPQATDIVILPDASKAFIACSGGHQVMVLGLATFPSAKEPAVPAEPDRLLAMLDVGRTPVQLALKPDGGEIFVSNFDSDTISEIATGTSEVGGAYIVGAHPARGIVNADNTLLWIANFDADTIAVYSIDDGKLINTVHVGGGPDAIAFSAEGHLLLAANARSGDVSVVRTTTREPNGTQLFGTLFTMLPAGKQPNAIVVKAFRLPK
jgi:YVTN family beta-propeller protein